MSERDKRSTGELIAKHTYSQYSSSLAGKRTPAPFSSAIAMVPHPCRPSLVTHTSRTCFFRHDSSSPESQMYHHHPSPPDDPERIFSPTPNHNPYDDADTYSFDPSARLSMLVKRTHSNTPESITTSGERTMTGFVDKRPSSPMSSISQSPAHLGGTDPLLPLNASSFPVNRNRQQSDGSEGIR